MRVCEPGGPGALLLGRSAWEQDSNSKVRALVYLTALLYCFFGVNTAADYFMSGVERITSARRRVQKKGTERLRTEKVWNEAVANLTLLALGSSAPEILLSCIEVTGNGFFSGALGPGTIVGSAAFNLFIIIAVCMYSIPDGEVRAIDRTAVYHVTVIFAMLAYCWLLFIVSVSSPDLIDLWEASVTLLLFFILLGLAYIADKGKMNCIAFDRKMKISKKPQAPLVDGVPSGVGSVSLSKPKDSSVSATSSKHAVHPRVRRSVANLGIASRQPPLVVEETEEEERLKADKIKLQQVIQERGHPDGAKEDGLIYNGDKPIENPNGVLTFWRDFVDIDIRHNPIDYEVEVIRRNGYEGEVTCTIRSIPLTATPERQYHEVHTKLVFGDQECSKTVNIRLKPMRSNQLNSSFQLILSEPTGGAELNPNNDGEDGESYLTFTLKNAHYSGRGNQRNMDKFIERFIKPDNLFYGFELWLDQIIMAFSVDGGDDEEDDEEGSAPSASEYIMHVVTFPWKIFFAFACPPACWWNGWLLFGAALMYIGIVTALISDLASLFGCCVQLPDEVTAITIVAMGTSLPDTFASMAAARDDDNADASVVNVTGSNSVNVYVGIGLPWTCAAIYWAVSGRTEAWIAQYPQETFPELYTNEAGFVVRGGNLGHSVMIFVNLAMIALVILRVRRLRCGGELGGPRRAKVISASLLVGLWLIYIGCSISHMSSSEGVNQVVTYTIVSFNAITILVGIVVEVLGPSEWEEGSTQKVVKAPEQEQQDTSALMILKAPKREIAQEAWQSFAAVASASAIKRRSRSSRASRATQDYMDYEDYQAFKSERTEVDATQVSDEIIEEQAPVRPGKKNKDSKSKKTKSISGAKDDDESVTQKKKKDKRGP